MGDRLDGVASRAAIRVESRLATFTGADRDKGGQPNGQGCGGPDGRTAEGRGPAGQANGREGT
ncbi:hypothetical protein GCM10010149_53100 [Nonomuraea roseoviolacea subsp. roseoviolacea]